MSDHNPMLFSLKLQSEIYRPWKQLYIDYDTLKKLLRENIYADGQAKWTEKNESDFVQQLDLELEKVYLFQVSEYKVIDEKITALENVIDQGVELPANSDTNKAFLASFNYESFQNSLEEALSLAQQLDKFARLNFTGFVKIVKKHDRLHPEYNVKPLLNVRLNELPFHSEDYLPLLYRISVLYAFLRENFPNKINPSSSLPSLVPVGLVALSKANIAAPDVVPEKSFKFWIDPDNLMEVKTKILRHLPVLIYNKGDFDAAGDDSDNIVTSLYFDNSHFELYNAKLLKTNNSPTVRLRWSGRLIEKPDIYMEKKLFHDDEEEELKSPGQSEKLLSFRIKEKYINDFIHGDPLVTKKIIKKAKNDANAVKNLLELINESGLEPTLRCVYSRTAFQIPGDDRVRITIDSDIVFIREDCFDKYRPIRDPSNWHRTDIDSQIDNPFSLLRPGEYAKFPHSVMEIMVKDGSVVSSIQSKTTTSRRSVKWIQELTNSHLVKEVPNFSKFIQGIAALHTEDDRLDILPFWLPELEKDIKKDPKEAYDEELENMQHRKKSISLIKKVNTFSPRLKPVKGVIVGDDLDDYDSSDNEEDLLIQAAPSEDEETTIVTNESQFQNIPRQTYTPVDEVEEEEFVLPPGVTEPKSYIKNNGEVKVEGKVWLANERTFVRWLHTGMMLFFFSVGVQKSAHKSNFPALSKTVSLVYLLITLFILGWGYYVFKKRLHIIYQRSGDHLDNIVGPLIVAASLTFILGFNFTMGLRKVMEEKDKFGVDLLNVGANYLEFFAKLVSAEQV